MTYTPRSLEICPYCGADIPLLPQSISARCPRCQSRVSISSFCQKEQLLLESIQQLRLQDESASPQINALLSEWHASSDGQLCALLHEADEQRRAGRFEEAAALYRKILKKSPNEAEIHWRLTLCRFGVEYVYDESAACALPTITCMDASGILQDADCRAARMQAGDSASRMFYLQEAQRINGLIEEYRFIREEEEPFDVFISVRQTLNEQTPTFDSLTATDLYYELEKMGLRAFNSRISLQQYMRFEYEPYIMHALSTAKVMIIVASDEANMNSAWVRSEWRRFRHLQKYVNPDLRLIACQINNGLWHIQEPGGLQIVRSGSRQAPMEQLRFLMEKTFGARRRVVPAADAAPAPLITDTPVVIDDPMLYASLCQAAEKKHPTQSDLAALTHLKLAARGIRSIEGLKHCSGLTELDLSGNAISDLSPLAWLFDLKKLNLEGNSFSDICPLSALTRLTHLTLSKNPGVDIEPLSHMDALEHLELEEMGLSDISPVAPLMHLTALRLGGNAISDLSPAARLLNLRELSIEGSLPDDLSVLAPLQNLRHLRLCSDASRSSAPVRGLEVIEALRQSGCIVEDAALPYIVSFNDSTLEAALRAQLDKPRSPVTTLDLLGIRQLVLKDKGIRSIDVLRLCPNLERLTVTNYQRAEKLTDISALASLHALRELDLRSNLISDLSPLAALPGLTKLYLYNNQISDLSPLSSLPALAELYLSHNRLTDVSALSALSTLTSLSLAGNRLSDVSPLAALSNLTFLCLDNNAISSLRPLEALTKLENLWFQWNPGTASNAPTVSALRSRGCKVALYDYNLT